LGKNHPNQSKLTHSRKENSYQKQLAVGFLERSTGVSPVCFGVLFGFDEREEIDQSPHGRDGHAPFLRDTMSNFKETLDAFRKKIASCKTEG
jgi:hypothetical protein